MLFSCIGVLALAWLAAAADYYKILDGMCATVDHVQDRGLTRVIVSA